MNRRQISQKHKPNPARVPRLAHVTPEKMIDVLKRHDGSIEVVAQYFGVTAHAIYAYLNRNEGMRDALNEIRSTQSEVDLDTAEKVLRFCMESLTDNPKLAQDTAKYILDNKGSSRGYGDRGQKDSQVKSKALLEDISKWSKQEYEEIKSMIDE